VFAWGQSGELTDADANLVLPDQQDALIEAVAAANPNTVVVLNTGGPVRMPWRDKVKAVLEMWYPGQEGGWATADILLGRANPAGKLPMTFPAHYRDTPMMEEGHPERSTPQAGVVRYSEGSLIGYRWYDTRKIEPLFPFGHGLSYTTFAYSGLSTRSAGRDVEVTFTVANTGTVPGAESAQVYLDAPASSPVPMPTKALAGFTKVRLAPGERKVLTIRIPQRAFQYWSTPDHRWQAIPAPRQVHVGGSSRELSLRAQVTPPR
jgi:beta-glucosidase